MDNMAEEILNQCKSMLPSSILIDVCRSGNLEAASKVVEAYKTEGRSLRTVDQDGWGAVHHASKITDTRILELLLKHDPALIRARTSEEQFTPLFIAVSSANVPVCEVILLHLDADDLVHKDAENKSILLHALLLTHPSSGAHAVLKLLLNKFKVTGNYLLNQINDICVTVNALGFKTTRVIPFEIIKTKDISLLRLFIEYGLDTGFVLSYDEADCSDIYRTYSHKAYSLIGSCVAENWTQGLELILDTHVEQLQKSATYNGYEGHPKSVTNMILASHFDSHTQTGFYSAWTLVFQYARLDCLKLMLCYRFDLYEPLPEKMENFPVHPLCAVFQPDIKIEHTLFDQARIEFLTYLMSRKPMKVLDSELYHSTPRSLWRNAICSRRTLVHYHPAFAAAEFLTEVCRNHGEEQMQRVYSMITSTGFNLDFKMIPYKRCGYAIHNQVTEETISSFLVKLIDRGSNFMAEDDSVLTCVLKLGVPISGKAVIAAACLLPRLSHKPYLNDMFKYLATKPSLEVRNVLKSVHFSGGQYLLVESPRFYRPCSDLHAIQLIMKGIEVKLPDIRTSDWLPHSCIKFSAKPSTSAEKVLVNDRFASILFANASRRITFFTDWRCSSDAALWLKDKYGSMCPDSLMSSCRRVIRRCIPSERLLREPVISEVSESALKDLKAKGWEKSCLEELPLPDNMLQYLRFFPEIKDYCKYVSTIIHNN